MYAASPLHVPNESQHMQTSQYTCFVWCYLNLLLIRPNVHHSHTLVTCFRVALSRMAERLEYSAKRLHFAIVHCEFLFTLCDKVLCGACVSSANTSAVLVCQVSTPLQSSSMFLDSRFEG
jgi:hypothetical protein